MGINDIGSGRSASQIKGDLETIIAAFTKPVYVATIEPQSSSSDDWATVANQTPDANNSVRTALNGNIRSGLAGAAGYIEFADIVETARDSGKWKVTGAAFGYTSDGLHSTRQGYDTWTDSERVDPRMFYKRPDLAPIIASAPQAAKAANNFALLTPSSLARPAFMANKGGTNQTGIAPSVSTQVTFGREVFDRGGYYNPSSSVWKPPAGIYCIFAEIGISAGIVDQNVLAAIIVKNGTGIAQTSVTPSGTTSMSVAVTALVEANGSDEFSVKIYPTGTGEKTISGTTVLSYFGGFAV
jgi:hypothetical protein